MDEFVPRDFVVPLRLETPQFVLEPLGPEHNDADYEAWSSSGEHIHATPGWEESCWPREMMPERTGQICNAMLTTSKPDGLHIYGARPGERDVIGWVYIYPSRRADDARALSWVRASHAHLDAPLWRVVTVWLASDWPFGSVKYAPRT